MQVKDIVDTDFTNYKVISMFIPSVCCDWKCCTEQNLAKSTCQNSPIAKQKNVEVSAEDLFSRYSANPITQAIVFGGLEPMLQIAEVIEVIEYFRDHGCVDPFIIYTGYYPEEVELEIQELKRYPNIIVKFGRFVPDSQSVDDPVLGVTLASNNQYAVKIS